MSEKTFIGEIEKYIHSVNSTLKNLRSNYKQVDDDFKHITRKCNLLSSSIQKLRLDMSTTENGLSNSQISNELEIIDNQSKDLIKSIHQIEDVSSNLA